MMDNPVLVEVTRGHRVESRHRMAAAVSDASGRLVWSAGDVETPVYPRSAVKAMQALPLVESGAADAFGFSARELALAQASHCGEAAHVEGVSAMLAAAGLSEADLECGCQRPSSAAAADDLIRGGGKPGPLHNNCSGKHAGFLATARHLGLDHRDYVSAAHPIQEVVREGLEAVIGAPHSAGGRGTDGCSIPTYAVPLAAVAAGFARLATGEGLGPKRAEAARRLIAAATAEPFCVAGTGRFDTDVMTLLAGAALVKTGAEGVHAAALPGLGVGVAVKCDDGASRATVAVTAAILARLLPAHEEGLRRWSHAPIRSRRGAEVGVVRIAADVLEALSPPGG